MSCQICFEVCADDQRSSEKVTCSDSNCKSFVCVICAESYMNFCQQNNVLPVCVDPNCKREYLYSNIKNLPNNIIKQYKKCVVSVLSRQTVDAVSDIVMQSEIIKKVGDERLKFVNMTFPEAITTIINIGFKHQLNRIKKQTVDKKHDRRCIKLLCHGSLDDNFKCILCNSTFCRECEQEKKGAHTCKEEDILSMTVVSKMVKCPSCKFPVERSYGCNFITCSICRTNFDYISGEVTKQGNHTTDEKLVIKTYDPLVDLGKEYPELQSYFNKIQLSKPKQVSWNTVVVCFKNQQVDSLDVCQRYERYIRYVLRYKRFGQCVNEIGELHQQRKLTSDLLEKFIEILKKN